MNKKQIIITLAAVAAGVAQAQTFDINYVDADATVGTGNTTGATFSTNGGQLNATWAFRGDFGSNTNVIQYRNNGAVDTAPELTTTITGLTTGITYDIWVFFGDNTSPADAYTIDAGLTSGSLTTYTGAGNPANGGPIAASAGIYNLNTPGVGDPTFNVTPLSGEFITSASTIDTYLVNIGSVTVDGTGSVAVFIDNSLSSGTPSDADQRRTWYDGVGYSVAVPEPSVAGLLAGVVALGAAATRRRRS